MEHKVAIVTGGARGLGRALAEALLNRGVGVCIADVREEEGAVAMKELQAQHGEDKVIFSQCDVSKDDQLSETWKLCEEKLGKPDLLVNNAGIGDEKNWRKTLEINLGGCIAGTLLAMERLGKASGGEGGRVVNVSSIAAVKNLPFGPIYSATKSGIVSFSRAVGHPLHYSLTGVKVQCLCPSMIETCFFKDSMKTPFSPDIAKAAAKLSGGLTFMPLPKVSDAFIKMLEEGPNGCVMVVEADKDPFYLDPQIS